jgi:hypothetical protein
MYWLGLQFMTSDDKEYKKFLLRSLKHKGGSIDCGEDYAKTKHDKLFVLSQRPNQLVLNECEKIHNSKFLI